MGTGPLGFPGLTVLGVTALEDGARITSALVSITTVGIISSVLKRDGLNGTIAPDKHELGTRGLQGSLDSDSSSLSWSLILSLTAPFSSANSLVGCLFSKSNRLSAAVYCLFSKRNMSARSGVDRVAFLGVTVFIVRTISTDCFVAARSTTLGKISDLCSSSVRG